MRAWAVAFLVSMSLCCADALAQSAKRGAAGAAQALSDALSKQTDADLEIELARKKAEIELETQRKLLEMRQERAQPQSRPDVEEAKLAGKHPQWVRIVNSYAFKSWMATRPTSYQQTCKETRSADVLASCINDFFDTAVFQARP